MTYRSDIQILRGVAVLLVVLFHLGFHPLKLGFLGVDIFFVISGYLMAILCGQGTIWSFYKRRARRLLPAYYFTILLVLVIAAFITLPIENRQVVEQTWYASVFAANIGFWMQNSYFSKSEFNPLLHLWSLGVEIQFYLIAPFLYYFGRKYYWFLPLLLLLSLGLCFVITNVSPKTSFFIMPFRIWQFLIGWLVAWYLSGNGAISSRPWAKAIGLVALFSFFVILSLPLDPEKKGIMLGHPGLAALAVCIATGAVLACGLPRILERSYVGRAFEILGNYSYSVYLVHFPVIVLVLYVPFSGTILDSDKITTLALLITLIIVLSIAMFHFIEKQGKFIYSGKTAISIILAILLLASASIPFNKSGFSENERKIFSSRTDRAVFRCGKIFRILNPTSDICEITPLELDKTAPKILLIGNSHADSIKISFAKIAAKHGYRVFFAVFNSPLTTPRYNNQWLIRKAKALNVSAVFLHFSPSKLSNLLGDLPSGLAEKNIKTILLMPVPVYSVNIPAALYNNYISGKALPKQMLTDYYKRNKDIFIYARSQNNNHFSYYDIGAILCTPQCRLRDNKGNPLYYDSHHINLTGARILEDLFSESLTNLRSKALHSSP